MFNGSVRLDVAGWLVLICHERIILLVGWCLVLIYCEKKILLLPDANRVNEAYTPTVILR